MLIDYTFFQGNILISGIVPPATSPALTASAINGDMGNYIAFYEREYLIKALGENVYEQFSEYLKSDRSEPVEIWEELSNVLVVNIGDNCKVSPIANYIYFFYARSHQGDVSVNGVKKDSDVGDLISPIDKMVNAWNDMVKMNKRLYGWLKKQNIEGWEFEKSLLEPINVFNL